MKTIIIPPSITIAEGNTLSFQQFVIDNLLADNQFGASLNDVRIAAHIRQAALSISNGKMEIAEPSYEKLVQVMENPLNGYAAKTAVLLLPFFDAISNAT